MKYSGGCSCGKVRYETGAKPVIQGHCHCVHWLVGVRAGTLDDPNQYKPSADIFVRSAVAWDHMDPSLPKFETYPPMDNA